MQKDELDTAPNSHASLPEADETSGPHGQVTDRLAQLADLLEDEDQSWVGEAVERLKTRVPVEIRCKEWAVGETVDERYQLVKLLGSGSYGVVFKARDVSLDRDVAVKLLHPAHSSVERYRKRFEQEARIAAGIHSDHVVTVHNVGTTVDSLVYIVMELVDGTSISEWQGSGARRSSKEIAEVVLQAAMGLFAAHEHGLIHRDIKCANLLIDRSNRIKISDFGLAVAVGPDDATISLAEHFAGTLAYMSPEQLSRPGAIDHRSDIFSLGVVLYELLGATRPFQGIPATILFQSPRSILHRSRNSTRTARAIWRRSRRSACESIRISVTKRRRSWPTICNGGCGTSRSSLARPVAQRKPGGGADAIQSSQHSPRSRCAPPLHQRCWPSTCI